MLSTDSGGVGWLLRCREVAAGSANVLTLEDDGHAVGWAADQPGASADAGDFDAQAAIPNAAIRVGCAALARMQHGEVLVRRWPAPALPWQWFRVVDEGMRLLVGSCGHLYEADEHDMVGAGRRVGGGWGRAVCTAVVVLRVRCALLPGTSLQPLAAVQGTGMTTGPVTAPPCLLMLAAVHPGAWACAVLAGRAAQGCGCRSRRAATAGRRGGPQLTGSQCNPRACLPGQLSISSLKAAARDLCAPRLPFPEINGSSAAMRPLLALRVIGLGVLNMHRYCLRL
jgi:hypothetical protein